MSVTEAGWQPAARPTADQVRFFRENGYLKFGRIFARDEIDALRVHVDEMIARLPAGKRPEAMDRPHFEDPSLFRYLTDSRALDVIQAFLGPDIVLWSSHFIAKPGGDGKAVPWHTDGAYWRERLQPMEVITLWLAVDESTRDNGCMRVIPGSHRGPHAAIEEYGKVDRETHVFDDLLSPELFDEATAVDLELAVGECHFHDAWTVHGSTLNTSPNRRCGYTMRYMPAHVFFDAGDWAAKHYIYLVRGEDRTGGRSVYRPVPDWS